MLPAEIKPDDALADLVADQVIAAKTVQQMASEIASLKTALWLVINAAGGAVEVSLTDLLTVNPEKIVLAKTEDPVRHVVLLEAKLKK